MHNVRPAGIVRSALRADFDRDHRTSARALGNPRSNGLRPIVGRHIAVMDLSALGTIRFPLTLLEEMGVDIWAFTREVDRLLEQAKKPTADVSDSTVAKAENMPNAGTLLREMTNQWLGRAENEARQLGHVFLESNIFC